jgi:hypothetical protein
MDLHNELVRRAADALERRHGGVEVSHRNNQFSALLPDGRRAVIKTGSRGQVMQRTRGTDVHARYTGVEDLDLAVIAVQNGPGESIAVYEVPGAIYRDRMTSTYAKLVQQSRKLRPDDLRVLRFDNKGYPEQRVAEAWAQYRIDFRGEVPATAMTSRQEVVAAAKAMIAEAFGVPVEKVSVSVNM